MHPFSTPLKTSENRKAVWCFQEVEKACIGNKWVQPNLHIFILENHDRETNVRFWKISVRDCSTKMDESHR